MGREQYHFVSEKCFIWATSWEKLFYATWFNNETVDEPVCIHTFWWALFVSTASMFWPILSKSLSVSVAWLDSLSLTSSQTLETGFLWQVYFISLSFLSVLVSSKKMFDISYWQAIMKNYSIKPSNLWKLTAGYLKVYVRCLSKLIYYNLANWNKEMLSLWTVKEVVISPMIRAYSPIQNCHGMSKTSNKKQMRNWKY